MTKPPFLKIINDFCQYISKDHTEPGENKCILTVGIDSSDDVDKSGSKRDSTSSQVVCHWSGTVKQRDQVISILMEHPFFNEGIRMYMAKQTLEDLFDSLLQQDEEE